MPTSATTKMSSKGQVVIPEEVRNALGLKAGSKFVVVGEGDVVILKLVTPPSMSDFDDIIQEARRQARQAGMKRSDVTAALKAVRTSR
jgi:AbrB family looped-hinge helix DNA binding protein